ncbi:MAG: 30S ribosomal protein S19 [Elusimicrobia bacterium RIFCSPLOWO2_01_FULL_59_12]|nr:MAG: 30S ribosomal protein S19 [Elusimicrobia bacterium RIFCSPLOWO2_01_FULL_59_12]
MARSTKKGPYVDEKLLKKVQRMNTSGDKKVIKTWARASMITPEFVGHTLAVHNGHKFLPVFITEEMVGHRVGEMAPTRFFKGHGAAHTKEATSLT